MIRLLTFLLAFTVTLVSAQSLAQKEAVMTNHARGSFEVKITPLKSDENAGFAPARMSIDKQFHGDIEATSRGEMMSAGNPKQSGVYVAIEQVSGTVRGLKGTFLLHHTGLMEGGKPSLTIAVVPGSGTGELEGITGTLNIVIAPDGKHSYDFEYTLPAK